VREEQSKENVIRIKKVIAEYTDVEMQDIQMESELTCDLGLTSFDLVCLMGSLEEEFGVTIDDTMMQGMQTVGDVYKALSK